jgi:hypothetical protein
MTALSTDLLATLGEDRALVVTGSLSAKVADRRLDRAQIHPVHVVDRGGVHHAPAFDDIGAQGVGALVLAGDGTAALVAEGERLLRVDLTTGARSVLAIRELEDLHEIEPADDDLLVANTARDQVVVLDEGWHEIARVDLGAFRSQGTSVGEDDDAMAPALRFHANQACIGPGGRRWVLVHHIEGYQLLRKVATKVLKVQGDGGLLALDGTDRRALRLTAPHSLTRVGDSWWIFDSGVGEVRCYDDGLSLQWKAPTAGWGRGAAVDEAAGVVWAGMSPVRRRYLGVVPGPHATASCAVEALSVQDGRSLGTIEIPDIEQINNVYLVDRPIGHRLAGLAS